MKIEIWWIGKTNEKYLQQGIDIYHKRLKHYNRVNLITIPDVKSPRDSGKLKALEGENILSKITNQDMLILCDENGKQYDSMKFAAQIESWMMRSQYKRLIFLIAGAYGASSELKSRANEQLSLSPLTFSHQMARLILLEQIYRGLTIIKNEKYHNV
ncbi:MAG: 23S rRNA (pseudouridine(1915)-N(3))-methyltransferase RlmH [Saprospiraceae bacterium]|nr:23S rRNA (pseudouridine(1915)-N(3))-methyltransferase RlmH [Saprospiraceae bacterium]